MHAVAFWAIERAYHEAWSSHMPMAQPFQQYAEVGGWVGGQANGFFVKQSAVGVSNVNLCVAMALHVHMQRWGSTSFGQYVSGLGQQADEALQGASEQER